MKIFKTILLSLLVSMAMLIPLASAASETILPSYEYNEWFCDPYDEANRGLWLETQEAFKEADTYQKVIADKGLDAGQELLACAVKTGYIKMWMLPFFIAWILGFLINIAGLLSILMIILGAYFYIAGGLTDDKEKGKTVIKYAIGGLVLTMLSWVIVQVLLLAVTS